MEIEATRLDDIFGLRSVKHSDHCSLFSKTWNKRTMAQEGLDHDFVQYNLSRSRTTGTVRSLHFQSSPNAQRKLVRCNRGRIFDVVVDIRRASRTYGEWVGVELTPKAGNQRLVPAGFLHGFMTFEPDSKVVYKCTAYHAPKSNSSVRRDSRQIDWPDRGAALCQGILVGRPVDIAYRNVWIDDQQLNRMIDPYDKSGYGEYIALLLEVGA